MSGFYSGLRRLASVLVGLVFVAAGIFKLMDPVGAGLVVEEYLKFFHLTFFNPIATTLAVMMALAEGIIGAALVTGVWPRSTAWVSGVVLSGFTLLTLLLVVLNPTIDCGCFGEVIHLTHLQTFLKNIILCLLWVLAFVPISRRLQPARIKYFSFALVSVSMALFALYSSLSIPLMDFTEFKPGTELAASMDEEWKMDDEESHDGVTLAFYDFYGDYQNELAAEGPVMIVSVHDPQALGNKEWNDIAAFLEDCTQAGFQPLLLTASAPSLIEAQLESLDAVKRSMLLMQTYFADPRVLLTLNRSNGGAVYVRDGEIIAKWSHRVRPDSVLLTELVSAEPLEMESRYTGNGRLKMEAFMLYIFAAMILI